MDMLCRLDRHRASAGAIWNGGFYFSFCERCGCDLVRRTEGNWRRVRPPVRVVWRARQPFDMPFVSAVAQPAETLPIAPEWRALIARQAGTSG